MPVENSNGILSDQYQKITVRDINGKEIATITHNEVIVADEFEVVLKPFYDKPKSQKGKE